MVSMSVFKEYDTVRLYGEDANWLWERRKRGETMADAFHKIRAIVEAEEAKK